MGETKERIYKWDNLKLFLIFCVVIGHVGNFFAKDSVMIAKIQYWVYLFHMPAFLFVSGLFAKGRVKRKEYLKIFSYVILFYLIKLLFWLTAMYLNGEASFDYFSEDGVAWYALAMFWCLLLTVWTQKIPRILMFIAALAAAVVVGYTDKVSGFLVLRRFITFYVFFYAGYALDAGKLHEFSKKWWVKAPSLIVLVGSVAGVYIYYDKIARLRMLLRGKFSYADIWPDGNPDAWKFRLAACLIAFVMILAIVSWMPDKKLPVSWMGANTLAVFALHYPVLTLLTRAWPAFKPWMLAGHTCIKGILLAVILTAVTALPPFNMVLTWIIQLPNTIAELFRKK